MPIAIPVAFLFSVIFTFGRLSSASELIALQAGGIRVERLLIPVASVGVTLTVICAFLTLDLVPKSYQSVKRRLHRIAGSQVVSKLESGTFTEGFFNFVIYVNSVDSEKGRIQGVFLYDARNKEHPLAVTAEQGHLIPRKDDSDQPVAILLRLQNGSIHNPPQAFVLENNGEEQSLLRESSDNELYQKIDFKTYDILIKIPEVSPFQPTKPSQLPFSELTNALAEAQKSEAQRTNSDPSLRTGSLLELKVELWKRISISISCIVFALLGMAFGMRRTRSVKSQSFLLSLLILALYYSAYMGASELGVAGKIPIIPSLFAPNILFLFLGWRMLRKAQRI